MPGTAFAAAGVLPWLILTCLRRPTGPIIFSGRTHWSNCSAVSRPSARAACLSVVPSLCAFLAIFAALS